MYWWEAWGPAPWASLKSGTDLSDCCKMLIGQKSRGKRTPAKPARATAMWRASLILQKSREAMARKEMEVDETSQSSVQKSADDAVTEQVTTSGWQRKCN